MRFLIILAACSIITFFMHLGMRCGYGAWAEREAERRANKKVREYLRQIEIRVNQRIEVQFYDETKTKEVIHSESSI